VPGWVIVGVLASIVTVTVALAPGCRVTLVGLSDSQVTSLLPSQLVNPGSTSAKFPSNAPGPLGLAAPPIL